MPTVPPDQWFNNLLTNLLNKLVWPVFFILSIVMLVWAGILFLTAQGDPSGLDKAKKALIWGIIGIIVAIIGFSAYTIIQSFIPSTQQQNANPAPPAAPAPGGMLQRG